MSKEAFAAIERRTPFGKEYISFVKSFPALIRTAGLCQAVALATTRDPGKIVLKDMVRILRAAGASVDTVDDLARQSREAGVVEYLRLSRFALDAATWVKRYVEALEPPSGVPAAAQPATPGASENA